MQIFGFEVGRQKTHIPSLSNLTDNYDDTTRINDYKSRDSQVSANVGWVFAANDIISQVCASIELKLVRTRGSKVTPVEQHEILDLLARPNAAMTGEQMRQLHYTYLNLVGESYTLMKMSEEGTRRRRQLPDALHILPAHLVTLDIKPILDESIVKFGQKEYLLRDVVRDFNPDPRNPYMGRSVVEAAASTIDTDEQSKKWNRKFFANAARPNMVVEVPELMEDAAYLRFKKQFNEQYGGSENVGKPLIIEGGASAKPFMLNQKEMDFLNSRKFTKDEILAMFKVSPGMLGMTENVNRSNMEASEYNFAKYVVKPRVRQYVELLNARLVTPYDATLRLTFDDPVPADKEHQLNANTQAVNHWMTIDEVRKANGLDELPNGAGATLYRPFNEVPIGSSPMIAEAESKAKAAESQAKTEAAKVKALQTELQAERSKKKEFYNTPEQREQIGEHRFELMVRNADKFELDFKRVAREHFERQQQETARLIRNNAKSFKAKGLDDYIIDFAALRGQFERAMLPIYRKLILVQGVEATALIADTSKLDFDIDDPDVVKFYENRAEVVSTIVDEETEKQIRASISEGLRKGESAAQLNARQQEVFGAASDYRAARISRTESIRSANYADIEAWSQSSIVEGKEWYTSKDQRRCPFCADMDGKVIGLQETYHEKGSTHQVTLRDAEGNTVTDANGNPKTVTQKHDFEAVQAPPTHPNCRCGLLPVIREF